MAKHIGDDTLGFTDTKTQNNNGKNIFIEMALKSDFK